MALVTLIFLWSLLCAQGQVMYSVDYSADVEVTADVTPEVFATGVATGFGRVVANTALVEGVVSVATGLSSVANSSDSPTYEQLIGAATNWAEDAVFSNAVPLLGVAFNSNLVGRLATGFRPLSSDITIGGGVLEFDVDAKDGSGGPVWGGASGAGQGSAVGAVAQILGAFSVDPSDFAAGGGIRLMMSIVTWVCFAFSVVGLLRHTAS